MSAELDKYFRAAANHVAEILADSNVQLRFTTQVMSGGVRVYKARIPRNKVIRPEVVDRLMGSVEGITIRDSHVYIEAPSEDTLRFESELAPFKEPYQREKMIWWVWFVMTVVSAFAVYHAWCNPDSLVRVPMKETIAWVRYLSSLFSSK